MTDKEKITEIIVNTYVPRRAANRIADALIKAGFGDVKAWKRRAEKAEQDVADWKNHAKALCKKLREVKE